MTSRERVLGALSHREPDRVPIDYSANPGIDGRLKAHFGLGPDDTEGLRRALGVDFAGVAAPYVGPRLHAEIPERRVDIWGVRTRWVEHDTGGYWDFCDFPLTEATVDEVVNWPLPAPDDFDYDAVTRQCALLRDYCLHVGSAGTGCIINRLAKWRGMEQILVDLVTDDERGLILLERKQAVELEIMRRTIEAAGEAASLLWMGEDLGTQIGPMIGLDLYRKHLRPWHQRFVDLGRQHGLKVVFHCCGSSSWAFEDFIDMGIDAVETLQPEALDMSPGYLKATYGDRLAFHGCISTAGPVAHGSVAGTVDDCAQTLAVMMPGGGYCFAPTHALQDNTPTENAVAMYYAAHRFGQYR